MYSPPWQEMVTNGRNYPQAKGCLQVKHRKLDWLHRWSNKFVKYVIRSAEIGTGEVSTVKVMPLRKKALVDSCVEY